MTIEDFLILLSDRELVPDSIILQLHDKVAKGDREITPKSLLKFLVKKGLVTQRQAKELLETTLTVTPKAESSILSSVPPPKKTDPSFEEEIPTIEPVSGDDGSDIFGRSSTGPGEAAPPPITESMDPELSDAIEAGNSEITRMEGAGKRKPRTWKKANKNEWDSSLLLLGGGGLVLLILAGVVIGYLLTRENADAILAEASEFYEGGSYTQAIKQYARFVENHPNHPEFSAGKVKLGLAKLWKTTTGTSNYTEALDMAQQVLPEIEDEKEFNTAHDELASLLPKIAQGLANQAEQASESEAVQSLVKQSNSALSLCNNTKYIPKTFRDEVLLSEVSETLERVERVREQNAALDQALTGMQQAIDAQDTAEAFQIHDQLLNAHPGLIDNEQLGAKVLEISQAESAVVKYIAESQAAMTKPRPSQVIAELALANRTGPTVESQSGIVAVRVSGAIYGLNVADGALRWRRYVGMAPRLTPVSLPNGELLVVDDRYHELLKLDAETGELIWRHSFESSIEIPVLLDTKILVAESAGKLHVLDSASGERQGYVQFAQKLSTPPGIGGQGNRIYLAGEHSSLYTLSADDFSCLGVFFLNHSKGSIAAPPVNVLNKVIVSVAKGLSTSRLEVLNTSATGVVTQRATNRRLSGLVNTPLLTEGRRLVVLTTRGEVTVYDVGSGDDKGALTQIAKRAGESDSQLARFGALHEGHVWVAGPKLTKLAILPTSDRMSVITIDRDYVGDTFDHPLQTRGDLLIHVRRPAGQAGAIVAAMSMEDGRSQWQNELAFPPAGTPAADTTGMRIGVITSSGSAYLVDREAMRTRVVNRAEQPSALRKFPPLTRSLDLGQGRLVASADDAETLLHFRPDQPRQVLTTIKLLSPQSCAPVVWDDVFVVPTHVGQVFLFNNEDAQQWGTPFQPPSEPGVEFQWISPAVYANGEDAQLVLSDGREKVYLLNRVINPQPHLEAVASVDLETSTLRTRFAVVGDLAMAGAEDGSLAIWELPKLESAPSIDLAAQVTWGPFNVGDHAILATATEELVCLDDQAQIRWRQPLGHGPPTGQPLLHEGAVLMLWQQGGLSKLELTGGEESAYVSLPQPVVAGPISFGQRLVVSSHDGSLMVVEQP